MNSKACLVEVILFDFGGVLAEEGFREGLLSIGEMNGLDPAGFMEKGFEVMHGCGYATGRVRESAYWQAMREQTGIKGTDEILRREIMARFVIRPWMMKLVKRLRDQAGVRLGILSDQTNWLDELNGRYGFFRYFDKVYNSYHEGKSKKDITIFEDITNWFAVEPEETLFIDDNSGNIERAGQAGLKTVLYEERDGFMEEIGLYCPFLTDAGC